MFEKQLLASGVTFNDDNAARKAALLYNSLGVEGVASMRRLPMTLTKRAIKR